MTAKRQKLLYLSTTRLKLNTSNVRVRAGLFCFVSPEIESSSTAFQFALLKIEISFHFMISRWIQNVIHVNLTSPPPSHPVSQFFASQIVWILHFLARHMDLLISLWMYCWFIRTSKSLFLMSRAINKSDVFQLTFVLFACMRRMVVHQLNTWVNWLKKIVTHVVIYQFVMLANVGDKFRINHHHLNVVNACDARPFICMVSMLPVTFSRTMSSCRWSGIVASWCQPPATSISRIYLVV